MAEIDDMGENVIAEHDDRDIHQVVGDENRSQRALAVVA